MLRRSGLISGRNDTAPGSRSLASVSCTTSRWPCAWASSESLTLLTRCYRVEEEKQMTLGRWRRAVAWLAAWVQRT